MNCSAKNINEAGFFLCDGGINAAAGWLAGKAIESGPVGALFGATWFTVTHLSAKLLSRVCTLEEEKVAPQQAVQGAMPAVSQARKIMGWAVEVFGMLAAFALVVAAGIELTVGTAISLAFNTIVFRCGLRFLSAFLCCWGTPLPTRGGVGAAAPQPPAGAPPAAPYQPSGRVVAPPAYSAA